MARIIFLCPFAKDELSGGIKTAYRQVELLADLGFEAWVYQPEGKPSWFGTRARVLTDPRLIAAPGDIWVFPETLNGMLTEMVQGRAARKVLFCQAHYYTLFNPIPPHRYRELGFAKSNKAIVSVQNGKLTIEPVKDLLELRGSLKTNKKPLSNEEMREFIAQAFADEAMGKGE